MLFWYFQAVTDVWCGGSQSRAWGLRLPGHLMHRIQRSGHEQHMSCDIETFFFFNFSGPHSWHMEVPRPRRGGESELQLLAYASHSNTGSLTHWAWSGIEPETSWILVRFISSAPQWELSLKLTILDVPWWHSGLTVRHCCDAVRFLVQELLHATVVPAAPKS